MSNLPTGSDVTALYPRPPQPAAPINPLADMATILQLKQAQQLLPLKLQQAQQDIQESKLKLDAATTEAQERMAIKQVLAKNGGDIEKSVPEILQVAPKTGLTFATSARQAQQEELKATGEKLKNAITSTELGARVLQGVPDAADPQAAYQQSIKVMQALGLDHGQMSPTYDPQQVQQYIQSGLSTKDKLEQKRQELKDRAEQLSKTVITADGVMQLNPDTGKYDIKIGEPAREQKIEHGPGGEVYVVNPNAKAVPVTTPNGEQLTGTLPADRNPTEASLAMQVAAGKRPGATPEQVQASRDAENALKRLDQSKREARPVNNFTLPNGGPQNPNAPPQTTGEEFLKSLSPSMAAQVKAIAGGAALMPPATTRSQAALQLRDMVFRYDPDYSDQRAQVRKSFTTGADGRNIGALNTAAVHLDQLADASKALSQGPIRPGNAIFNSLMQTFGGAAPTNFDGVKAAVSGEMASALKGNATDQEIKNIQSTIDRSNSPEQLAGIVSEDLKILGAKLNTYQERYRQQIPNDLVWNPALPAARAAFAKHGVPLGGAQATPPATGLNAPPIGTIKGGYKFKGGNPADKNNWVKQ